MACKKDSAISEFFEVDKEYRALSDQLFFLVFDANRITYGCYLTLGWSYNYHRNWFAGGNEGGRNPLPKYYGKGKKRATVWEFYYHLGEYKKDLERLRSLLAQGRPGELLGWIQAEEN